MSSSGSRSPAPSPTSLPILLADEPTGNLDSANGRHIVELLHRVNRSRGTTIVLVTHDSELASGTDVTLRMRDGRTERVSPAPVRGGGRMTFVLRMVGRELRASWRRLAFFFVCVAVGVSAIVALRSVIQQVGVAMAGETRALLAADVEIESEQPWSEAALAVDRRRPRAPSRSLEPDPAR